MAITTYRTGYRQTLASVTVWDTLFDSSVSGCGSPARTMWFEAITQDVELRITGLDEDGTGALATHRITAGSNRELSAFVRNSGRITKVEARAIVLGALVSWEPSMA